MMTNEEMKSLISATIIETLRNPKKRQTRPTIDELEKILNSEDPPTIDILPDGSVTADLPIYAPDLAEAIIKALRDSDVFA